MSNSNDSKHASRRLQWFVPEEFGGIKDYAHMLWPAVREACEAAHWVTSEPVYASIKNWSSAFEEIVRTKPDLLHIQHEFGLFGSKIPPFYQFPRVRMDLRRALPQTKLIATAHTVLGRDFKYDWKGRGPQALARWLSNYTWVPWVRPLWMERTWGMLDGAIVHSGLQLADMQASGVPRSVVIPHFVPPLSDVTTTNPMQGDPLLKSLDKSLKNLVVFGFFSMEKGQDLAVQAFYELAKTRQDVRLILAGGARRKSDQGYFKRVKDQIHDLGLSDRVLITGYISEACVDEYFDCADLVLAPFRSTMGSGSLAQALSRRKPVLASDLPLNVEIAERTKNALHTFKAGDPADFAAQIAHLLDHALALEKARQGAATYAVAHSPAAMAQKHLSFYQNAW